ncbi:hypothetical protein CPB83DRAFT_846098 [Crepidotus variabilis]|uniref:F-box domain-containing protein n=1 Tax=Crepidotus variabilis TaxID=179855 RepID=A0A9P6EQH6_9AGAR|nr:hypothetical protein CPB83DRAFT_846098 [Crepidotus variabilis]
MSFSSLPVDVLILVFESLNVDDLSSLAQTCRVVHSAITEFGWSSYLYLHPRQSYSLSAAKRGWQPRTIARYDAKSDLSWDTQAFIARPLSRTWSGKHQPVVVITPSRLVVGAGNHIYSYAFGHARYASVAPPVSFEGSASLQDHPERPRNITALVSIEDGDKNCTFDIAFQDGAIERIYLNPSRPNASRLPSTPELSITRYRLPEMPASDFVESLSSQADIVLALSSNGSARLTNTSFTSPTHEIDIRSRSWTSYLSLSSSTPYAAFGTASTTPLTVHPIFEGGELSPLPSAILHSKKMLAGELPLADKLPSSAVYGLSKGPPNAQWGSSPQILVSGWYDGKVRVYDLRVPSITSCRYTTNRAPSPLSPNSETTNASTTINQTHIIPIHTPILSLVDRWSYEPIYSVSSGGGSASHIAAGTARHSVVSFWDIRKPATGWSVHAPGNDPSPVYSVILESSRFFGVTQSRPFVYDFGPGVSLDTYPSLPLIRGFDNLKQKKGTNQATYHVLRYTHSTSGIY